MESRFFSAFGAGWLVVLSAGFSFAQAPAAASAERKLLDQYCVTCHNQRLKTANLTLDKMDLEHVADGAEVWEKVIRKIHGGTMPPVGMPRPDPATLRGLAQWLETSIDHAAANNINPGRTALHRLNRTEYANAIRDLLALDIDATALLPGDDESNGFDNIADVLKVSPLLLEQYIGASRKISSLAVGDPKTPPVGQVYRIPPDLAQEHHIEGLPLGTRGGILVRHNFPLDADYDFGISILRNIVGYMPGMEFAHEIEISIDGVRVFSARVGGPEDNLLMDTNLGVAGEAVDARLKTRVPVKAGPHAVGFAFAQKNLAESDEPLQPFTRELDLQNMNGIPLIDHVQIAGPFEATGPGDTPSRRRIFTCRPGGGKDDISCAKQILTSLAKRAYRRPVGEADLEELLSFYQAGKNQGNFETGIENALRLILANPKFIFRAESDATVSAGQVHRISDLELASRLSFFLWSSIPDEPLLTVAAQGKLQDPAELERQVKRMLADPKSESLVKNFAGQWLLLRNLQSVAPDNQTFPNFDDNLRQAFRTETEMLFSSILHEDRSVLDLMNANYTFVNERLAKHYGIPHIYGSQFRRVTLADENRWGLLGQGSVLTVTSYPNRTSAVLRGKWILENVLGTPPPAPPPNVPALKENGDGKQLSLRQLMEQHRANPACATCHKVMDPLGLALENFDAVGQWRTKEAAGPIDAAGQLADGTKVTGVVDLRKALLEHPEQFAQTITEKMMTYALGRGLEYYDMPVVRGIVREAAKSNYRFSALIMGIVESAPFEMRKAASPEPIAGLSAR